MVGGIFAEMGDSHAAAQYATRQMETLNSIHASVSEQVRGRLLLAQALVGQGRLADAKAQSEQALVSSTPYPDLHDQAQVLNAGVLFALGQYDGASRAIEEFDRKHSDSAPPTATHARAISLRAELLARVDRMDDALPLFRAAVAEGLAAEGPHSMAAIDIRPSAEMYLLGYGRIAQSREFSDAALSALHSAGSTGQIRAALEEVRLARRSFRMGGMTFADARKAFERVQADIAARGPSVPQAIKATIDFDIGAATIVC